MIRKLVFLLICTSFVVTRHRQESSFTRSISNADLGLKDSPQNTIMMNSFSDYYNAIVTVNRKTLQLTRLSSSSQSRSFDISAGGYHSIIADPFSSKLCGLNNETKKVEVFSVAGGIFRLVRSWTVDLPAPIGSQLSAYWHPQTSYLFVKNFASFQLLDLSSTSGQVYDIRKFADIFGTEGATMRGLVPFGNDGSNQYVANLIFKPVFYILNLLNPSQYLRVQIKDNQLSDSQSSLVVDTEDKAVWYVQHVHTRLAKWRYDGSPNLVLLLDAQNFFVPPNQANRASVLARGLAQLCDVPGSGYLVFYTDQITGVVRKSDFGVEHLYDSTPEGLTSSVFPLLSAFIVRRGDSIFASRIMINAQKTETTVLVEEFKSSNKLGTLCPTGQAHYENRCLTGQIPSGFGIDPIDNSAKQCLVKSCLNCANDYRFCQVCEGSSVFDSVQGVCPPPPKPVPAACTVANCLVCSNNICSQCDPNTAFKVLSGNKCIQAKDLPADGNGVDPSTNTVKPCSLGDCADCRTNFKECNACKPGYQMSLQKTCSKEGFEGDIPESFVERPFAPENAGNLAQVTSFVGPYKFNFVFYAAPSVVSPKVAFKADTTFAAFISSYLSTHHQVSLDQVDSQKHSVDVSSFHSFTEYVQVKKTTDLKAVVYFLLSQNFKYAIDLRSAQVFYDKVKACAERFSVTEFNVAPQIRNSVALVRTQLVFTDCSVKGQFRLLVHSGTGRVAAAGGSQLKAADLDVVDRAVKGQLNRRVLGILA